ncbi:MAG: AlkA N-terminal domain-containing protein [Ilumatobacteraceae bacterium]
MQLDQDRCYLAVQSKDSRFDGWFVTAVRTTGIYCRPSCPATTPKRHNVEFFLAAATAQLHGYRACKRCRPDATPGSPEWNTRADVVGRAMRLISDGLVDREGVGGLAARLGYSERQVHRHLVAEIGCGPLALARAQRAQTARVLIETTEMPITDVAFGAGFTSVRQFNDTIREIFAATPSTLRAGRRSRPDQHRQITSESGQLTVRLAFRSPLETSELFSFLGQRAVPGVESFDGFTFRRALRLAHGGAVASLTPGPEAVWCTLVLDDIADVQAAVQRCRRLLDLDADPVSVDHHLASDPVLAPLVAKRGGLRSPGHPDGAELLVRAMLGQQISVGAARGLAGRLVDAIGEPLVHPAIAAGVTHLFPSAAALAALDPTTLPMPAARGRAIVGACAQLADRRIVIDAGSDRAEVFASLVALPGIGPWTANYVAMRALGDPDVFMPTDLGVRHALVAAGLDPAPRAAAEYALRWAPWRSYALHHLWAGLAAGNVPKHVATADTVRRSNR